MFAASFILRKVYREMFKWPQDHSMKLAVVLDEAHRMAKDVTLPKLMKEGRKYGLSVIVASQNADDFHKDILGNAGTKIVFRNEPPRFSVGSRIPARTWRCRPEPLIVKLNVGVAYVSIPQSAGSSYIHAGMKHSDRQDWQSPWTAIAFKSGPRVIRPASAISDLRPAHAGPASLDISGWVVTDRLPGTPSLPAPSAYGSTTNSSSSCASTIDLIARAPRHGRA